MFIFLSIIITFSIKHGYFSFEIPYHTNRWFIFRFTITFVSRRFSQLSLIPIVRIIMLNFLTLINIQNSIIVPQEIDSFFDFDASIAWTLAVALSWWYSLSPAFCLRWESIDSIFCFGFSLAAFTLIYSILYSYSNVIYEFIQILLFLTIKICFCEFEKYLMRESGVSRP